MKALVAIRLSLIDVLVVSYENKNEVPLREEILSIEKKLKYIFFLPYETKNHCKF